MQTTSRRHYDSPIYRTAPKAGGETGWGFKGETMSGRVLESLRAMKRGTPLARMAFEVAYALSQGWATWSEQTGAVLTDQGREVLRAAEKGIVDASKATGAV
jgi:hypothetical protein